VDINELVASVELESVRFVEASGLLASQLDVPLPEGDVTFELKTPSWDRRIEVWVRTTVRILDDALIRVAVSVTYVREDETPVPDDVKAAFLERVAVMAAFPYLREGVQSLATRVGVAVPTLGLLKQAHVTLIPAEALPTEP